MWFSVELCSTLTLGPSVCWNGSWYQIIHVVGRTLNAAVTSHRVQRESMRPGAVGDAQLELKQKENQS